MVRIQSLLWIVLVAFSGSYAAAEKPLVAVVALAARSLDSASVAVVEEAISSELMKSQKVRVLERSQMEKILREQGFQESGVCDLGNCTVEIGRMLAVNQILTGSLGRLGGSYSLSLRLIDVKTGEVINSITRNQKGEIDAVLTELLPIAVSQLLTVPIDQAAKPTPPQAKPTTPGASPVAPEPPKESKSSVWPWIVGGTVIAGAGVAAVLLLGGNSSSSDNSTTPPPNNNSTTSEVVITLP